MLLRIGRVWHNQCDSVVQGETIRRAYLNVNLLKLFQCEFSSDCSIFAAEVQLYILPKSGIRIEFGDFGCLELAEGNGRLEVIVWQADFDAPTLNGCQYGSGYDGI